MRLLLDTHIIWWALIEPEHLTSEVVALLEDPDNDIFYSIVSVWEVAIKHRLHPVSMPVPEEDFVTFSEQSGLNLLQIHPRHIYAIKTLNRESHAPKHNDPFDRLLIAQAKVEKLAFITHDSLIPDYNEPCVLFI